MKLISCTNMVGLIPGLDLGSTLQASSKSQGLGVYFRDYMHSCLHRKEIKEINVIAFGHVSAVSIKYYRQGPLHSLSPTKQGGKKSKQMQAIIMIICTVGLFSCPSLEDSYAPKGLEQ